MTFFVYNTPQPVYSFSMAKFRRTWWSWQDDSNRRHRTLVAALRARRSGELERLWLVGQYDRHGAVHVVTPISAVAVRRALRDFVRGQCGALAVDLGDGSRQGVLLAEQMCSHSRARLVLYGPRRVGVRRARSLALCMLVAMQVDPVRKALLVMRLRSRRRGETPPHRMLEAFLRAEAGV